MSTPSRDDWTDVKRKRLAGGRRAEELAALILRLKGYTIVGRRWKSAAGEIDLIAATAKRLHFIEVKRTPGTTDADAHEAVSHGQRARIHAAAETWLARHAGYRDFEMHFDLVLVAPWRWPRHIADGL